MLLIYDNNSDSTVCFVCIFMNGTNALGCIIIYQSMTSNLNGSLMIFKEEKYRCVDYISTHEYSISVYDIEQDGVIANKPAYQILILIIAGEQQLSSLLLTLSSEYDLIPTTNSNFISVHSSDDNRITSVIINPDEQQTIKPESK